MEASGQSLNRPFLNRGEYALRYVLGVAALVGLGAGVAIMLYRQPPTNMMIAGGLGVLGLTALAIARYETAATLGFLLLGVVFIEPAPPDAVFAIVIAVAIVTGRFDPRRAPLIIGGLLGVFLVVNLMSSIEAFDPVIAAKFFGITLYLAVFGLWLAGYVNSPRRARGVVLAYIWIAVLSALVGVLALYGPMPDSQRFVAVYGSRAQALFQDPNVFGPFLIPPALILLEEMLKPRLLKAGNRTKLALFLILTIGILVSYSRAAWISLIVGILVLLSIHIIRRGGGRRALRVLAVLSVSAAATTAVLAASGSIGFLQQRAQAQSYDTQRFGAQKTGLELIERYPFGIGPGQFEVRYPVATHSLYVRSVSEQGAIGLAAILGLVISTLVFAVRNAVAGQDTFGIGSAALLGSWCALALNSFFVDTLHWRHLWVVAALIWVAAARRGRMAPPVSPPLHERSA